MYKTAIFAACVATAAGECSTEEKEACNKEAGIENGKWDCDKVDKYLTCAVGKGCFKPEDDCDEDLEKFISSMNCDKDCKAMATCFPASAMVELKNGQFKSMDELVIGDEVRVGPDEFSEVYMFSTELTDTTTKFVKISTEDKELSLTPSHFLYVNGELAQAGDVKVGDVVVLGNGTKAPVTAIGSTWATGLYNPHTLHGDIVVDGLRTSTYTNAVHPKLAHAILSPIRAMYTAGVSYGKGFSGALKGLPTWVRQAITA